MPGVLPECVSGMLLCQAFNEIAPHAIRAVRPHRRGLKGRLPETEVLFRKAITEDQISPPELLRSREGVLGIVEEIPEDQEIIKYFLKIDKDLGFDFNSGVFSI